LSVISRFSGIVVFMNYRDHNPPHLHAKYQGEEVTIEIQTGTVTGSMSLRALQLLFEWIERYQEELLENWELTRSHKPLRPIPPL
jgi:desulfoferrodoxin (superoxide reductase-like protein)